MRGQNSFPFKFQLPESSLPCSFESKSCQIRYFIKVTIDIPYASPPQGVKYFTIIGPHHDCMDEQYLVSICFRVTNSAWSRLRWEPALKSIQPKTLRNFLIVLRTETLDWSWSTIQVLLLLSPWHSPSQGNARTIRLLFGRVHPLARRHWQSKWRECLLEDQAGSSRWPPSKYQRA